MPAHLTRVVTKLSSSRASGAIGEAFDAVIDAVSRELDIARAAKGGVRGDARQALVDRLADLDRELLAVARAAVADPERASLEREAGDELAAYRGSMAPDAYARARDTCSNKSVRCPCWPAASGTAPAQRDPNPRRHLGFRESDRSLKSAPRSVRAGRQADGAE